MATKKSNQSNGAHTTLERADAPTPVVQWPAPPEGFKRVPSEPIWFAGDELRGVLVDAEPTEAPSGEKCEALVFIATASTRGIDNYGNVLEVAEKQAVRVRAPSLLKFAPFAMNQDTVRHCIVRRAVDTKGRERYAFELGAEVSRASFVPVVAAS